MLLSRLEKAEALGTGENFAEPSRARAKVFLGLTPSPGFLIAPQILEYGLKTRK